MDMSINGHNNVLCSVSVCSLIPYTLLSIIYLQLHHQKKAKKSKLELKKINRLSYADLCFNLDVENPSVTLFNAKYIFYVGMRILINK